MKMCTPIQDDDDHVVFADADTISSAVIRCLMQVCFTTHQECEYTSWF